MVYQLSIAVGIKIKMLISFLFVLFAIPIIITGQTVANSSSSEAILIEKLRNETRGPYKDIRWFCKDGTVIDPKAKCPDGGYQHARLRDEIVGLANKQHLFLTQILTGTDYKKFWDDDRRHSRMIQYQLEQFLFNNDRGWINEKGQYYRGAKQEEDEAEWGRAFLFSILEDKSNVIDNYLLIRRAARDIPHGQDNADSKLVRSLSLALADIDNGFQHIRIKIHGSPQKSDIELVKNYIKSGKMKAAGAKVADDLIATMEQLYNRDDTLMIQNLTKKFPNKSLAREVLTGYVNQYHQLSISQLCETTADILAMLRTSAAQFGKASERLAVIDLTNLLEDILLVKANAVSTPDIGDGLEMMCVLSTALLGTGYIQPWEYNMMPEIKVGASISIGMYESIIESYRRSIQWGTGMVYGYYKDDVNRWSGFEPKVSGFIDDVIRSSPMLPMGLILDRLYGLYTKTANVQSRVMDIKDASGIKGVNPGIAKGILEVMDDFAENPVLDPSKIYIFNQPPKELKPLAGIATVTEGNTVSHVQLLARNLAIPNAAIPIEVLQRLKKYKGKEIFYAVSQKGAVIMKLSSEMNDTEKALFKAAQGQRKKIAISLDKLQLQNDKILNIRAIDAKSSGVLCGPKAANLAELKNIFPDKVVEGVVIPFGIYKSHMEQKIPGRSITYWEYIREVLYHLEDVGSMWPHSADSLDSYQNAQLGELRKTVMGVALKPQFQVALRDSFVRVLGSKIGSVPVFLRSDTNMEDLKEFTGAGLNLTLFNVLEEEDIWKGIKEVWASPFSERSYKWRQKYLENPEDIYPSILVIPSVNVEKSGVLITKGISNNIDQDLTIAFSQGVGGAVDGQSSETYLSHHAAKYTLISPSREYAYKTIPASGGTVTNSKGLGKMTLTGNDLKMIRNLAKEVREIMPSRGMEGPYDVELGIKDGKIWLFQIRPFVENKNAKSLEYLNTLTPYVDPAKMVSTNTPLI